MAKNIDAILNSIQGLFTNAGSQNSVLGKDGFFIVPEYQRAYNWRANEQCDKLWQDVESFIETKKNDSYFLGSIIINSDRDQLYIIDGQQRVTTFLLLLKALLLRINGLLQTMSFDDDSRSVKTGWRTAGTVSSAACTGSTRTIYRWSPAVRCAFAI